MEAISPCLADVCCSFQHCGRPVVENHPLPLSDRLRLVGTAGGRAEEDTHISLPASRTTGVVCHNKPEPHTCWKEACPRARTPHTDKSRAHALKHLHTHHTCKNTGKTYAKKWFDICNCHMCTFNKCMILWHRVIHVDMHAQKRLCNTTQSRYTVATTAFGLELAHMEGSKS